MSTADVTFPNIQLSESVELTTAKFEVGALKFWALADRILIQEDEFKSGHECPSCDGKGRTACPECHGEGKYQIEGHERSCANCESKGTTVCTDCEGKGGLIIVPETAQRRPTTGKIVSVGDGVKYLKLGDSVLYSNFAGYVVDLDRAGVKVTLRILHESEVLCGMEGHLTLSNLKGKSEIATFNS